MVCAVKSNFWVNVKLYSKKGQVNGKTTQNELHMHTWTIHYGHFYHYLKGACTNLAMNAKKKGKVKEHPRGVTNVKPVTTNSIFLVMCITSCWMPK